MKQNLPQNDGHPVRRSRFHCKLRISLLLGICLMAISATYAQAAKITISRENATMLQIMSDVEEQSGLTFAYSTSAVNSLGKISINVKDASVSEVMDVCLRGSAYTYAIENNVIVLKQAPLRTITGKIINKDDKTPVIGAAVQIKGSHAGVSSDVDGMYRISTREENPVLVISHLGMKTVEVEVGARSVLDVVMEADIQSVKEVTVVAYGTRDKKELISSVSSVKAADIDEMPTSSLENLLQGHMAGLEVSNVSGSPGGGGSVVRVRGYNSLLESVSGSGSYGLGDGSPLYVIDGVPVSSFTSPVTGTNTLAEIDPATIASVEVLKDAASAAMYGSRASNGVILITTKQGQSGKAKLSANASYSYAILPKTPTQMIGNVERRLRLAMGQAARAPYFDYATGTYKMPESYHDSYGKGSSTGNVYDYYWNLGNTSLDADRDRILQDSLNTFYNNSTNWWKYAFQPGRILNANIQAAGGTDNMRYLVGAGWYDEKGIMVGSDFSRANVISNLNVTPRKNFKLDMRTYLAYTDRSRGGANLNGSTGTARKIEGMTVDPRNYSSLYPGSGVVQEQLLKKLNETVEKNTSFRTRASLHASYTFLKSFNISSSVAIDYTLANRNSSFPASYYSDGKGSEVEAQNMGLSMLTNENLLSYVKSINNNHNIDAIAGYSYTRTAANMLGGGARGGPSDNIHYVGEGWPDIMEYYDKQGNYMYSSAMQKFRSDFYEIMMQSVFGRVAYNYKKKYLAELTVRADGSSTFGDDKWRTFPSMAVGWNFSDEDFMSSMWWLSHGKLRLSWGKTGQQFSDPYLAHGTWTVGSSFLGNTGLVPETPVNSSMTWELSDQYDLGLDLDMFESRLRFKFDYYYKYSSSLLYNTELPGDVYFHNKAFQNVLEISNEGFEIEAMVDIFRHTEVKWRMKFNIARNWNKFEKSYTNMDMAHSPNMLVVGKPVYGLYVYKDKGIVQKEEDIPVYYDQKGNPQKLTDGGMPYMPGMRLFEDLNNDGKINADDMYYAGSVLPAAYGGIASELTWNGFDLSLLFTYVLGRNVINNYAYGSVSYDNPWNIRPIYGDVSPSDFWSKEGDKTKYPTMATAAGRYYGNQFSASYDSLIEKVNYIRLKQVTLGYNLPKRWTSAIDVEKVRVFFTAENLFILSNYSGVDPEIIEPNIGYDNFSSYPLSRKMTIGLTLTF